MITDVFDLLVSAQTGFLSIGEHLLDQMRVLLLLSGGINQAWIRRGILRLELLDRFKIGGVRDDFRKLLQLFQLVQFCSGFLFLNDSNAHDNSSLLWLNSTVRPNDTSTTTN